MTKDITKHIMDPWSRERFGVGQDNIEYLTLCGRWIKKTTDESAMACELCSTIHQSKSSQPRRAQKEPRP